MSAENIEEIKSRISRAIPQIPSKNRIEDFVKNYKCKTDALSLKEMFASNFFTINYTPKEVYFGEMVGKNRSGLGVCLKGTSCF